MSSCLTAVSCDSHLISISCRRSPRFDLAAILALGPAKISCFPPLFLSPVLPSCHPIPSHIHPRGTQPIPSFCASVNPLAGVVRQSSCGLAAHAAHSHTHTHTKRASKLWYVPQLPCLTCPISLFDLCESDLPRSGTGCFAPHASPSQHATMAAKTGPEKAAGPCVVRTESCGFREGRPRPLSGWS